MGWQVSLPDWISVLSSRLWDMPLHHLYIPGSHGTMTYCLNKKSQEVSHKESRLLQLLGKVLPCVTLPMVLKWSTTQGGSVAGCWWEDLWMAHMEEGTERNLHSGHMVYMMALMEKALTEILEWLKNHPQEVVILVCRNFKGMMEDLHEYLMGCIENILGDMLCPRGKVPTLHQLWSQGQQVILSYKDKTSMSQHAELWPSIPYWWGNQVEPQDFVHCLECMKSCSHPGRLFMAGINLTENLEFVCIHLVSGEAGPHPGSAAGCTNTIAGHFIWANGFVGDHHQKLLWG
uniref:PI-PLC X domain-containing protein 1 n=1 Tax=Capra hircus TaxID=9925 RepID=A0A452EJL5_CAPHI